MNADYLPKHATDIEACDWLKAQTRGLLWKQAIAGQIPTGPGCADGDAAIEANNKIFSAMGFGGTPTIISENGEQVPEFETAAEIANWLDQHSPKS